MKIGLVMLLLWASKPVALDFPKSAHDRCRLILAMAAGALGNPEAPNFCANGSYSAYGRVIIDAMITRSSGDSEWLVPALPSSYVCRNDFGEVYQPARWRKRLLPPEILSLHLEKTKEPSTYRFGAHVKSSTDRPNEGSIMLCGTASGVVRKKGESWVVELDKDDD
jgi:hypothetical protein